MAGNLDPLMPLDVDVPLNKYIDQGRRRRPATCRCRYLVHLSLAQSFRQVNKFLNVFTVIGAQKVAFFPLKIGQDREDSD